MNLRYYKYNMPVSICGVKINNTYISKSYYTRNEYHIFFILKKPRFRIDLKFNGFNHFKKRSNREFLKEIRDYVNMCRRHKPKFIIKPEFYRNANI